MNEHELQTLTEEISRTSFHREFTQQISYNKRLRSSGGRYLLKTGNIEINPNIEDKLGIEANMSFAIIIFIKWVVATVTETRTLNNSFIKWAAVALSNE